MSQHSSHSWIGRSIGDQERYRLEQWLGGGGMGDVFLATDTRLGKPVALKLLKDTLAIDQDIDLKQRFERECAICAALKSVHIVQVSDYGVTTEGFPFYVMEYLQGQTLGQLLTNQPQLSIAQTCNIITQVCEGLELAHSGVVIWNRETNSSERIKVVHRDLKPDNILLVPTVLGELAKIIDFGIAKIHSLQTEYTTHTTVFLGTCHYAAPEQFNIYAEVDERTDIYSLGIILYEMLAGTDPFGLDFKNNRVTNNAWLAAHAEKTPRPLRSQPHCSHIPPALEAVVSRCLEKSPADRLASVTALKAALLAAQNSSASVDTSANSVPANLVPANLVPANPVPATTSVHSPSPLPPLSPPLPPSPLSRKLPWLVGSAAAILVASVYAVPLIRPGGQNSVSNNPNLSSITPSAIPASAESTSADPFALTETLSGSAPVRSVVLNPDGKTLISAGEERDSLQQRYPIKVWDIANQRVSQTLDGHTDVIQSLSLSNDGQLLASGGRDAQIHLWNLATGELSKTLSGHTAPVWSVALSADQQTLVSGSEDRTIRIWNLKTNQSRVLSEHIDTVYSVALSPDGRTIASASADKTIRLWDAETGELLRTLGEPGGHRDVVSAVAFSPDGQMLVSAGWDGFVKLWNASTGQLLQTFEGHTDRVVTVAFIDPQMIASAGFDRTVKIWSTAGGQPTQTISAHSDQVLALASVAKRPLNGAGQEQTLASSSSDTTIKIWR
ncbi:MAG: serine/threonine protein kinase [Elainella sp. C42_A2020_010]|nr:serine/threonine protein kinase [Elainella sp. C42_A2020_010]